MGEKNLTRVLIALAHEFNSLFLNDLKCPVRFGFYKKKKKKKRILGGKKVIFIEIYKVLKKKKEKRKLIVTVVLFCIQRKLALALTHAPCI